MEQIYDSYKINIFEERYGYRFSKPELLREALTHTSYSNEYYQSTGEPISNNERLEFLGDTVMGTIISAYIFERFPKFSEGALSKIRSSIVCESSLAECFLKNGMEEFIMLGKGEEMTGGRKRNSVLADCFEAIIGAIFLDGGFGPAASYINRVMAEIIKKGIETYEMADAKTLLQETLRKIGIYSPQYEVVDIEGPDHNKIFTTKVTVIPDKPFENGTANNNIINLYGEGKGQSKKESEQKAALDFIKKINL